MKLREMVAKLVKGFISVSSERDTADKSPEQELSLQFEVGFGKGMSDNQDEQQLQPTLEMSEYNRKGLSDELQSEPFLGENSNRFVLFPIHVWQMYKKAEASFGTTEELGLVHDLKDGAILTTIASSSSTCWASSRRATVS
ncbi:unnamed protein product [Phytophthora fragariaefolia]|uniref:Unnamed protein product n=1 Tax=Phytophthora fragariaefolia TaxID=1490495 RepID=A0A9W6WT80_9STRA|nr:unnamed protein product [Phytophthora fragariaefolia]